MERPGPEDIEGIKSMLDAVGSKVPALLKGLRDVFYSPEAGRTIGQAVGAFYKELVDQGVARDDAVKMAADYLSMIQKLGAPELIGPATGLGGGSQEEDTAPGPEPTEAAPGMLWKNRSGKQGSEESLDRWASLPESHKHGKR